MSAHGHTARAALSDGPMAAQALALALGARRERTLRENCAPGRPLHDAGVRYQAFRGRGGVYYLEGQDPTAAAPASKLRVAGLEARLLGVLRARGPQTEADLARRVGLSTTPVRARLDTLRRAGAVIARGAPNQTRVWALPADGAAAQRLANEARARRIERQRVSGCLANWSRGPLSRTAWARLVALLRVEAHTVKSASAELRRGVGGVRAVVDEAFVAALLEDMARAGAATVERMGGEAVYSLDLPAR